MTGVQNRPTRRLLFIYESIDFMVFSTDCYNAFDENDCFNSSSTPKPTVPDITHHPNKTQVRYCGAHEFQCTKPLECIPMAARCDSYHDCLDRSDELNCSHTNPRANLTFDSACLHPNRICLANGKCILVDQLCNQISDCPDGNSYFYSLFSY